MAILNKGFIKIPQITGPWDGWEVTTSALNPYSVNWSFNDSNSASTLTVNLISNDGVYKYNKLSSTLKNLMYSQKCEIGIGSFTFNGYFTDFNIEQSPEQKVLSLEFVDMAADLDRWYVGLYKRHGDFTGSNSASRLIICGKEYNPCDPSLDSNRPYNNTGGVAVDPCDPCPTMPRDKYKYSCNQINVAFNIWETWYTFDELLSYINEKFTIKKIVNGKLQPMDFNTGNKSFRSQHVGKLKDVLSAWCSDLGLSYYWDPINSSLVFVDRSQPINIPSYDSLNKIDKIIDLKYGETAKSTFSRGFLGFFSKEGDIHDYTCSTDPVDAFVTLVPLKPHFSADELVGIGLAKYSKSLYSAWSWLKKGGDELGLTKVNYLSEDQAKYLNQSVLSPEQINSLGDYYYFIADVDENYALKKYEYYQYLASDILGKYWAKTKFYPVAIGSYFDEKKSVQVEAAGGSGKFYTNYNDLVNWPVDVTMFDASFSMPGQGVIGVERQPVWSPDSGDQSHEAIFSYWEQFIPKPVGSDGRPPELFRLFPNVGPSTKLFIAKTAPVLLVSTSQGSNPLEPGLQTKTQSIQDAAGVSYEKPIGSIGATTSCSIITVGGFSFYCPVGADGTGSNTVYAAASDSFKIALPKVQTTITYPVGATNVSQIDYHYNEARENNLDLVNGAKTCIPTAQQIASYFEAISANTHYYQDFPQKKASFKLPGICPVLYSVSDGLISLQVTLTSNGFFTSYSLEDKIILPPSDEYIIQSIIAKTIPRGSLARQYINSKDSQIVNPGG